MSSASSAHKQNFGSSIIRGTKSFGATPLDPLVSFQGWNATSGEQHVPAKRGVAFSGNGSEEQGEVDRAERDSVLLV